MFRHRYLRRHDEFRANRDRHIHSHAARTACPATADQQLDRPRLGGSWSVGDELEHWDDSQWRCDRCIANGAAGSITVTVDSGVSVGGLYIDAGNTVSISANQIFEVAGTVSNAGTIILNVTNGNNVVLTMNSAVTLTGGGTVSMSKGQQRHADPQQHNAGALTNVNNTIQGAGQIGNNGLILTTRRLA